MVEQSIPRQGGELRLGLAAFAVALAALVATATASASDRVYWTNNVNPGAVQVGNLDGSGSVSSLFPGENMPFGVAINPATGKIYWADQVAAPSGAIRVANLDGSGSPLSLFTGETYPNGVAIDPVAGKIYWGDNSTGKIRVGNLDGSGSPSDLFHATNPVSVAIDPADGKIYWSDNGTNTLKVADLNGSGSPQTLFSDIVHGVALDPAAGKIYWANGGAIRVGNLNGSGSPSDLFTGQNTYGVALDPGAGKIYWADLGTGAIRVGNLNGSGSPSDLFTGQSIPLLPVLLRSPAGLGAPQVSGGSGLGSVLTCSQGLWASDLLGAFLYRAPQSLAFQWNLNGADIAGANASSYTAFVAGDYRCRVIAANQAGTSAQTSAPHTVGTGSVTTAAGTGSTTTKATITQLSETNSTFAVGGSSTPLTGQTAAKRHKRGTVFSLRLDQPATVKIAIQTKVRGRRVRGACRPDSLRLRRKPRCTRTITIATLTRTARAGLNEVAFSGRIGGKALKAGRYQAAFTAIDSAGASVAKTLSFRIVKS